MRKKNTILFITTFVFTIAIFILFIVNMGLASAEEEKKNPNNYWSTENTPIFYGASKISMPAGEEFNVKDARFRVFARDFEDGELTRDIQIKSNNVDTSSDGTYEVIYRVIDSHGNKTDFTQTVIVETGRTKYNIERVVYTLPSADNLHATGVYRADGQDKQILGIYLTKDATARIRSIDSDTNLSVVYYANDDYLQGGSTNVPKDGSYVTLKNEFNARDSQGKVTSTLTSNNSVPLLQTVMLTNSNNSLTKTFKIELEFDVLDESARSNVGEVRRLKYYYYKDNFDDFRSDWYVPSSVYTPLTRGNFDYSGEIYDEFAIVDSYRLMVVVDSWAWNKMCDFVLKNADGQITATGWFDTLDEHLEYYNKLINRYDEILGVSKNPENITNQNVESKNVVKPNTHGPGGAYYGRNQIGVSGSSSYSFFQVNWGGLHEVGHGYQGTFGNGSQMNLGETSNNIFAVYVQRDKTIYKNEGSWLGEMNEREIEVNNYRYTTGGWPDNTDLKRRLYILMNIFDNLEGATTYGKMFAWYRDKYINENYRRENHDAYAESLADLYHINIIPYLEAWGLNITESVKKDIYSKNYKLYNILGDTIHDTNLTNFMSSNNLELKYALIDNSLYKMSGLKNNLNLTINIDNMSKVIGKRILIKDGNTVIKNYEITSSNVIIKDIPVGTYFIQMPSIDGYTTDNEYILIKDNEESSISFLYTPFGDYDFGNYVSLRVKGSYNTYGCVVTFSENYTKATISFPNGASIGTNSGAYVKIIDDEGNTVALEEAKYESKDGAPNYVESGGQYFNWTKASYTVDIGDGFVLEIKEPTANGRLKIFSTYTTSYDPSNAITDYDSTTGPTRGGGDVNRYIIENNTFKREGMSDEVAEEIAYYYLKGHLTSLIDNYKNSTSEKVLSDRTADFENKLMIMQAYSKLNSEDKAEYTSLLTKIVKGGSPVITYNGKTTYTKNDNVDLMSLISVIDTEDDTIIPNSSNTTITTDLDLNKNGVYTVKYSVTDSDGNTSTLEVDITVNNIEELVVEEEVKPVVNKIVKASPKTEETNTSSTTTTKIIEEENTTINDEITTVSIEKQDDKKENGGSKKESKKQNKKMSEKTKKIITVVATSTVLITGLSGLFYFLKIKLK